MKLALGGFFVLMIGAALVGGTTASLAAAPRAAQPLFAWVPPSGFADAFPFGQCTWWAAYNHPVSWNGNAADWLRNAQDEGAPTNGLPSVGAIVVYRPGGAYSPYGHVAIVTALTTTSYSVSEMNAAAGWGRVSTRTISWPDPDVLGFIPAS